VNNITITLTGVDEHTNLIDASYLEAEIGILYSATPEGRNRYPKYDWIKANCGFLPRAALHVCGSMARLALLAGRLDSILVGFQRVQINGAVSLLEIEQACYDHPEIQFITQHNKRNLDLLKFKSPNHQLLVDASGGRGISPDKWERPMTDKIVGFAGGLGPDNLAGQMETIRGLAAGEPSWVDMEGKLRINDWFSISIARDVLGIFHGVTQ
jgi:hypothetical protein